MAAWAPFRIDPRITSALHSQRGPIAKGLICVAIGALLTAAMIPLTERAIRSIGAAAPLAVDLRQLNPAAGPLAQSLGVPTERVTESLQKHPADPRAALPPPERIAEDLEVPVERVVAAYQDLKPHPPEDLTAIRERQDQALRDLGLTCLLVVALFAIKYFATRGQVYYLSMAANRLASDLRIRLHAKLQRLPIRYYAGRRAGGIQSVLTHDVSVYQTAVGLIRDSIDGPFKAVAAIVAIFVMQWQLAVVALLFVPVLVWFIQRNGRKMRDDQGRVQEDLARLSGFTSEALGGMRVIKAFAAEERMEALYAKEVQASYESQMRAARRFAALRPMVELVGAVSLATILYICGHLARAGQLEISEIVALTLALDVINQGFRAISNVNNTYNQVQAAANRIYGEVLDVPEEAGVTGGRTLPDPVGRIEFRGVKFAYPDGTLALRGVDFVLEPGTSLALVGPSGAGKSTIADLMLRFDDPAEGQILFDGVDVRELDVNWLRQQFGVVPQNTFLFAGTIRDNIRLGAERASEEELALAASRAHADVFIERMPERYEANLGERGAKLSGGEAQRIAIARALAREPKVLLMDEATSNLDAESERAVTEALDEVMHARTTLFIAHRLTTAVRADRILVLRRGEVLEEGTPEELLRRKGAFSSMMQAFQAGMLEDADDARGG